MQINREALIQLKRVLENSIKNEVLHNDKPVNFDMGFFFNTSRASAHCGTSACAAGSAALDPWFIKQGFAIDYIENRVVYTKNGITKRGFHACEEFFGLDQEQTYHLFDPDNYYLKAYPVTQQQVIERIDEMLAKE